MVATERGGSAFSCEKVWIGGRRRGNKIPKLSFESFCISPWRLLNWCKKRDAENTIRGDGGISGAPTSLEPRGKEGHGERKLPDQTECQSAFPLTRPADGA